MNTASISFDPALFCKRLQAAPELCPLFEEQAYSPYLKEHVFDRLREEGSFELMSLDLNAFEMRHVLPANMGGAVRSVHSSWAQGLNAKLRSIKAQAKPTPAFF